MITLAKYEDEKDIICELIKQFWIAHNDYTPADEEKFYIFFIRLCQNLARNT